MTKKQGEIHCEKCQRFVTKCLHAIIGNKYDW